MRLGPLDFGYPWVLALLLLPLLWWVRRRRARTAITFSRAGVLARGPRAGRTLPRTIAALRWLTLAASIVALARPRSGARARNRRATAINILLTVDLSSSMLAEDLQPTTGSRSRAGCSRTSCGTPGRSHRRGRLRGRGADQVPLTTDYPVVTAAIANLQAGQLEDGTAIGTAIATSPTDCAMRPGAVA
jgi:Ca-activated chloride channel family protein